MAEDRCAAIRAVYLLFFGNAYTVGANLFATKRVPKSQINLPLQNMFSSAALRRQCGCPEFVAGCVVVRHRQLVGLAVDFDGAEKLQARRRTDAAFESCRQTRKPHFRSERVVERVRPK